jgi:hypothetical protein
MSDKFLNSPDVCCCANVRIPGGGRDIWFGESAADEFKADPDRFAAREFGLTKEEYLEWIRLEGAALCSERTKTGAQCRAVVGCFSQWDPTEWKQYHRLVPCKAHRGKEQPASTKDAAIDELKSKTPAG